MSYAGYKIAERGWNRGIYEKLTLGMVFRRAFGIHICCFIQKNIQSCRIIC